MRTIAFTQQTNGDVNASATNYYWLRIDNIAISTDQSQTIDYDCSDNTVGVIPAAKF
ncbi:MAG: hypothetical protein L0154_28735 [Chloroflexi bacterium]|nr:hypothetical protein [Chloroflexota bacterium]